MAVVLFKNEITSATSREALIFAVVILLFPLIVIFIPKATVALLVLPVLPLLFSMPNRGAVFGALPRMVLVIMAVLAAWSLITIWWSPRPFGGLELWARVVGIGLCGTVMFATAARMTAADRQFLRPAFALSGWSFVALFALEILTDGFLSGLGVSLWNLLTPWDTDPSRPSMLLLEASAGLAVFAWPCMLAIRARNSTAIAVLFAIAVAAMLLVQNMQASLVAFASGVVAYAAVYIFRRWGAVVFLVGLALVNLALVLIAFETASMDQREGINAALSGGARERLHIIDFVYGKIFQHPVTGWGFDASRAIGQDTLGGFGDNKSIPLHPHNLWAQTWLELGAIGLVMVISLVAAVSLRINARGRGRQAAAAAMAGVAAYLLIGNISYGMWQNWWLAIAWLNVGFFAVTADTDNAEESS